MLSFYKMKKIVFFTFFLIFFSSFIYGARAMAGVIVVTTKKGRAGSFRLNYTGEFTTRLKPSYRILNALLTNFDRKYCNLFFLLQISLFIRELIISPISTPISYESKSLPMIFNKSLPK